MTVGRSLVQSSGDLVSWQSHRACQALTASDAVAPQLGACSIIEPSAPGGGYDALGEAIGSTRSLSPGRYVRVLISAAGGEITVDGASYSRLWTGVVGPDTYDWDAHQVRYSCYDIGYVADQYRSVSAPIAASGVPPIAPTDIDDWPVINDIGGWRSIGTLTLGGRAVHYIDPATSAVWSAVDLIDTLFAQASGESLLDWDLLDLSDGALAAYAVRWELSGLTLWERIARIVPPGLTWRFIPGVGSLTLVVGVVETVDQVAGSADVSPAVFERVTAGVDALHVRPSGPDLCTLTLDAQRSGGLDVGILRPQWDLADEPAHAADPEDHPSVFAEWILDEEWDGTGWLIEGVADGLAGASDDDGAYQHTGLVPHASHLRIEPVVCTADGLVPARIFLRSAAGTVTDLSDAAALTIRHDPNPVLTLRIPVSDTRGAGLHGSLWLADRLAAGDALLITCSFRQPLTRSADWYRGVSRQPRDFPRVLVDVRPGSEWRVLRGTQLASDSVQADTSVVRDTAGLVAHRDALLRSRLGPDAPRYSVTWTEHDWVTPDDLANPGTLVAHWNGMPLGAVIVERHWDLVAWSTRYVAGPPPAGTALRIAV